MFGLPYSRQRDDTHGQVGAHTAVISLTIHVKTRCNYDPCEDTL